MHVEAKFAKMLMLVTTITIMKMVLVMIMLMVKKMMMKRMMVLMMAIHMCFARFLNTIVRNPGMQMLFMCRSRSQVYIPLGRW